MVLVVKNPPANAGDIRDASSISGLGRSFGGGHGNPLQYSCLEYPMDRGACQAPLSMRFSRQEQWSGLACPPLGDLPDPGIKPMSLMSPALAGGFFTTTRTIWEWENNNQKSMGCYCTKAVLKGKFIVIQAHTGNFLKSHINNLILYTKE